MENLTQQYLIVDNLFNIMIESDIETINNLCVTNKNNNVCNNEYFWVEKFNHDNMPIIIYRNNFSTWIKEYIAVKEAKIKALEILQLYLENSTIAKDVIKLDIWELNSTEYLHFTLPTDIITNIHDGIYAGWLTTLNITVDLTEDGYYNIKYVGSKNKSEILTYNEIKNILINLIYLKYRAIIQMGIYSKNQSYSLYKKYKL